MPRHNMDLLTFPYFLTVFFKQSSLEPARILYFLAIILYHKYAKIANYNCELDNISYALVDIPYLAAQRLMFSSVRLVNFNISFQ